MHTSYLVFFGLFIFARAVRFVYERLKRSGRADPENKILFAAIFADMCVLWISWFAMVPLDPVRVIIPSVIGEAGLILVLIGAVLAVGGMIQLRGVENINALRTTDLYRRLRHPTYTGFILWTVGWVVYHGAVVSLSAGLVGIANILWWRRLEEDNLLAQLGEAYRQCRLRTWF